MALRGEAAKLGTHYRFHDLRHSFGTDLANEGRTFDDIAAILGITVAMARVYGHRDSEKLQLEAIDAKRCTNSALTAPAVRK